MGDYLLAEDMVSLECFVRRPEALTVLVRWNNGGPEHLVGQKAAEVHFTLKEGDNKVMITTEPGIDADSDFAQALCRVYGVYAAHVSSIDRRNIVPIGNVKVR